MDAHQFESLTPTERRVLLLVHHSRKSDAIAPLARMSRHTVDQHIKSARAKLGNVGRYVAADMLRAFEERHPQRQGSELQGMAGEALIEPHADLPDQHLDAAAVAEEPASFIGTDPTDQSGQADHLGQWLEERTILSRVVLVLAATFLLLLLIVSAPLLAERMGQIGLLLYR